MNPILLQLFAVFFKVGAFTFGGGYAMIALLDQICVDEHQWVTADELANILVVAESTPGPIAINLATYTGYQQCGIAGAISATLGMITPSIMLLYLISMFFDNMIAYPIVAQAFAGIRVAVAILITGAGVRMVNQIRKKAKKMTLPALFIGVTFVIATILNFYNVHYSTIYFILVSGFVGTFVYGKKPPKPGKGGAS